MFWYIPAKGPLPPSLVLYLDLRVSYFGCYIRNFGAGWQNFY